MYGFIDGYDFGEMEAVIKFTKQCTYPFSFSLISTGGKKNG